MESPYAIVGLGNPGRRYAGTRHNAGFEVVDRLAQQWSAAFAGGKGEYLVATAHIAAGRVLLAKPTTFMNLSGHAVQGLTAFYRVEMERLLLVSDDVNMQLGSIRLRPGGSSGGHKGLEDVIYQLGRDDFARLRIGVGSERMPPDLTGFVLEPFRSEERSVIDETIALAAEAVETWLESGLDEAMNRFNRAKGQPDGTDA
jgi:PTH1 family peptidyl-tRNA hydrolase